MSSVLIFAEYLRSMAWSTTAWIPAIALELAARGHDVHVFCDGIEDPAIFSIAPGHLRVHTRRPMRKLRASDPLGFARWCGESLDAHPGSRSISFTRYFPGDLWIPLGRPIMQAIFHAMRAHRPATAAMEILHRPWAPKALLAEHAAQSRADRTHARLGDFRSPSASPSAPSTSTGPQEPAWLTPLALGFASTITPSSPEHVESLRSRVRKLLSIPESALVVGLSAVHHDRAGLRDFFEGAAAAIQSHVPPSPDLHILVMGRKTHTLHTLVSACGAAAQTHLIGGTQRADAFLAACDVAVSTPTRVDPSSTGRFIADALMMGLPVLTTHTAPGADLLKPGPEQSVSAGLILDFPTPDAWRRALRTAASPPWRAVAAARARALAPTLTIAALVDRLSSGLGLGPAASTHPAIALPA